MGYYLIENFASGLDLRRSAEVGAPGSLRTLRNGFINEGGEIEKRKAFVRDNTLTNYCRDVSRIGRVTGPHPVPGYPNSVFFRHRATSLPTSGWTAGGGGEAAYYSLGEGFQEMKFWAMRSSLAAADFGALFHGGSVAEFGNQVYLNEAYVKTGGQSFGRQYVTIDFTDGEPTAETEVSDNEDRAFQAILRGKGYVVDRNVLYASAVNDPGVMSGTGSGNVLISTVGSPIGNAIALAEYYGQLAVFGRKGVQFWDVDADFAENHYDRKVKTSVFAPRSVLEYGDGDVLFLARSGIRSLQAQDSSNKARVSDIGSPIDLLIRKELDYASAETELLFSTATPDQSIADFYQLATAKVNDDTGQAWVALKNKFYVYSRYDAAKVHAWSAYDIPVPPNEAPTTGPLKARWVADMCQINETLVFRNFADEVYLYGGETGSQYDAAELVVELPYIDIGRPGDEKTWQGIDLVCEGRWNIEAAILTHPEEQDPAWFKIAEVNGRTRDQGRIGDGIGKGKQLSLRLTTRSERAAKLAQIGIFYDQGAQK